ncbi:MAG TPA: putative LPS assembly protein LptD, partial [Longimicrobiales bacterium]|nr:putative LPS assembly protein LptD [Longimicrobiales bacterium]
MARDPGSLKPRRRGVAAALESARAVAPGLALALAATLQAALFPRALVARQVADTARQADSVPQAAAQEADSAAEADSTRLRVLERLERLARPPGYDSVLYALDSARLADAEAGRRPVSSMDSVAATLARMPGYTLTEYEGGTARFQAADRVLQLEAAEGARAAVSQEGMRVEADTAISFDQTTGILRMVGNATLTPPEGDPVESPNMVYDVDEARGTALDARTSYAQGGARWLVRGDMPYAAQDSSYMSHARFTSCDLEVPHYHFETDQIKIVGGNVLVARGVRLYFADVPVFWLPFVAQSLSSGRRSGLLTPRFSVNDIVRTSGGYRRRVSNVGFYWAMSDYSDALVALDWFSETFTSVTGQIQYRWARQFLDGNLSMRHYWQADGGKQLALDTRHAWQIDERTNLRLSARYARDNDFVRDFSFNPREVTQSIDSEGGIDRRFGWGALSVSANRRQFLSDDRTEWTLPAVNLSLTPITLFRSDAEDPHFWNNMTWSGSSGFRRSTLDQAQAAGEAFSFGRADTETRNAFVRSNLSMGNLTLSQSADVTENLTMGVPEALLLPGDSANPADLVTGAPARDIAEARLNWSASVSYQQQLIGSTTLTPRVSITGSMLRADTSSLAQDFVAAPSRISVGAGLKTDIYGFFPGFGGFEAIRHKISPSFDWQWSPATSPSALQQQVFGSRALQPRNTLAVTLNQTFEAKREADPADTAAAAAAADTATAGGPRRIPRAEIISLLALRTSVV